jgi:cytochrome b561
MSLPAGAPLSQPIVSYDRIVRLLHWATAALLLVVFGIGISMTRWVAEDDRIRVYSWHEWAGLTVFALTAIRVWRRTRGSAPAIDLPRFERLVRAVVHTAIYLVLIVQPIVGYMMTSAFGFEIVYLGLVPLPRLVAENRDLATRLQAVHETLAITLFLLFLVHLGAIANHHLFRRDGVMRRMLP